MIDQSVRDRVSRAKGLVAGVTPHGDLYTVEASDGGRWYTVNLNHDTYPQTCECQDWKIQVLDKGNQNHCCKHIFAAQIFESRENCRRTGKPKTDTRHEDRIAERLGA